MSFRPTGFGIMIATLFAASQAVSQTTSPPVGDDIEGFSEAPPLPEVAVRAVPRGSAALITPDDYPAALQHGEQGFVRVALLIGPDGRTSGCAVSISSGSPLLDLAACTLLRRRARFVPAAKADGSPTPDRWMYGHHWRAPVRASRTS